MIRHEYQPRLIDSLLEELIGQFGAVMLVGPRASGKTTTARRYAKTVFRLDSDVDRSAILVDPDAVLAQAARPVLLDEWQLVPEVLGAVKRAVDDDSSSGQFLLTGSVRADALSSGWPATGRVIRLNQYGFCQRELVGAPDRQSFFDLAFKGELPSLFKSIEPVALREYIELSLRGGFPDVVLNRSSSREHRWLKGYIDQLLTRDAPLLGEHRDPKRLHQYLRAVAMSTAGIIEHKRLFDAAGVSRATGVAYDALLELLMVTEQVPAWSTNLLNRLTRAPKRYLIDPSFVQPLLGLEPRGVIRNTDLLGRLLDTFVLAQLRPERDTAKIEPTLYHLRQQDGRREIDLLAEAPDGRVFAMEVKASSAPDLSSAQHLIWLRERLGASFVGGVVFHTGPRAFTLAPKILALPIAALWSHALAA